MMARLSCQLIFTIIVFYANAQIDSVQSRLKGIQGQVRLDFSPEVAEKIQDYTLNSFQNTHRILDRFFFYDKKLKQIFEQKGVPSELRYACISLSNCGQPIHDNLVKKGWYNLSYQNAKKQGLFLSNYIDERFDVLKSAQAFCDVILKIKRRYQDWREAYVVFCSGDALWQKAKIISGDSTNDFFLINSYLETTYKQSYGDYVAAVYMVDYFKRRDLIKTDYLETTDVPIDQFVTFDRISKKLDIDLIQLRSLNPIYKKSIVPNIERLNYLKIPTSKVGLFYQLRDSLFTETNSDSARHYPLDKLKSKSSTSSGFVNIVYTVRSGDVLIRIADLYDCSVSQIRRWNNIRGDYLRINQRLIIKKPSNQQAYYRRINKMTKAQKNNIIRKD
jgi:membrane-bound lytic murein transglycosylase D